MAFVGIPKECVVNIRRIDGTEIEGIVRYATEAGIVLYGEEENKSMLVPWHIMYEIIVTEKEKAATFNTNEQL